MTDLKAKKVELLLNVDFQQLVIDIVNFLDYDELVDLVVMVDEIIGDTHFTKQLQEAVLDLE